MTDVSVNRELPFAVSWTIDEPMARSSHALAVDGRVWLIDPVADEGALVASQELGEIAGVLQLLDRHDRDCAALASRYGVEHLRLPDAIEGAPFEPFEVLSVPGWREVGLWWQEHSLLVVAEAVGTCGYFAVGGRALGMHPMLRLLPPGPLRGRAPERLLVGHGPPLHSGAGEALSQALARSRRDAPRAAVEIVRSFSPGR